MAAYAGFGWLLASREQGMLSETPGAAIVQAPEGDSFDDIFVLLEDREKRGVVIGLSFKVFDRWWRTRRGSGLVRSRDRIVRRTRRES